MEFLIIAGAIVSIPVLFYSIKYTKFQNLPPSREPKQEKDQTEEISFSKFNAQLRREKILENMSPEEKKLFLQSSGYTSPETLEHDDEFVIYTNFCTTLLLLALSSSLIYYLVTNTLPSLSFRLDL